MPTKKTTTASKFVSASREVAELKEALGRTAHRVIWFSTILTWALNRCENTPQALVQLIKDKATQFHSEALALQEKQRRDKKE